ncbi:hypothetical protein [Pseudoduganella violacea]|uniref:Uncharacterized protein n=1 Tax=Pseudoduganella violacea TaxID=1715466 RepID=A0A7W5B848_9BURK|nr:hypothetical protein [Pseudoduganella violacea]MBB3118284.1 hypothetical protein [Pseudoduganella violacea]
MKIHYLETWPRVDGVDYAAETVSLKAILPAPGQQLSLAFALADGGQTGDVLRLLWQPPFSAENGWSERPSELRQTFLVSAKVLRVVRDEADCRHDVEIVSCEALFPVLKALREDEASWQLPTVLDTQTDPPHVFLTLEEVIWCGMATVDGLTYIAASTAAEAYMQLIVEEVGGQLFGLFCAHSDPGGAFCRIGRRRLGGREERAVRQAMQTSRPLADSCGPYLGA